jgi:hypothetical protein
MFRDVIAVEAQVIVEFHNPESRLIELLQGAPMKIHMIEDPEAHEYSSFCPVQASSKRTGLVFPFLWPAS